MQSAGERLAKGTIVYMIGNLLSKVLQVLILPIITVSLITSEYGYYDLIVTTISLVTPIITFQMIEGMFRNMFNATENEKRETVTTVTFFLIAGAILLGGILIIVAFAFPSIQYPFLIYLNYISAIIFNYVQKLARCQQKNTQFAISGVINTIVMLVCQAITLLVFHMGVDGMLLANCISYFIASFYLAYYLKISQWFRIQSFDKKTLKSLFMYSAPLVPNSIGWWLVSSSDRYVITFFMDSAANGIYSIAGKFSQLLTFITSVFQLAWQESAIMEENSESRDGFYTKTFNLYMKLLLGGYLFILPFIKLVFPVLLNTDYQSGYLYNPVLLIGSIFAAFSQFYGSAYVVFKRTSGAFTTTMVAAVINIIIGVGLISWLGLFAPALGTAVAFGVQWVLRAHQLKDCFHVTIDKRAGLTLSISLIITTFSYYIDNNIVQIIAMLFGIIIFVVFNKEFLKSVLRKVLRRG